MIEGNKGAGSPSDRNDRALALVWRSVSSACALTSCSCVTSSLRQARAKAGPRSALSSPIISINLWSSSLPIGANEGGQ